MLGSIFTFSIGSKSNRRECNWFDYYSKQRLRSTPLDAIQTRIHLRCNDSLRCKGNAHTQLHGIISTIHQRISK